MEIQLLTYKQKKGHVSQDTVDEFESVIIDSNVEIRYIGHFTEVLGKVLNKVQDVFKVTIPFDIIKGDKYCTFAVLMGKEFQKTIVPFSFNKKNSIYLFDAWPESHKLIESFIKKVSVKHVFFSSRQVTETFKQKNLSCKFSWIPEGIHVSNYRQKDYSEKDIDVLSFGRKYDLLHEKIVNDMQCSGKKYLYEKKKGEIVFKDRQDFIDGLSRTKISICIPSCITHPERSGNISTMTVRYLQSMVSKSLVLGYLPEEMKELFDYNPIVELDIHNPSKQILSILENFNNYIPLIERNYQVVVDNHTWKSRWSRIKQILPNS
jgi:hypothetical protein